MYYQKEAVLQRPVWDKESVSLKDFLNANDVPCVSKVVQGQFLNIGASRFIPLKKLHQKIIVHSIQKELKVLGHSVNKVYSRDRRTYKLLPLKQTVSIPTTYRGWFELVSENGHIAKPIDNVRDLAKLFPKVINVLVRQNIKAFVANDRNGKMTFDMKKVVNAGEQLKIVGDLTTCTQTISNMVTQVRLLKCTDVRGDALYLGFDQRGLFSPVANETDVTGDVTGVFLIKDIINRFRLPLTVKLVHGVWPKVDATRFTGLIRLDLEYTDEIAFVCPLNRKAHRLYTIPTEVSLGLSTAVNNKDLKVNEAFTNIMVMCNRLVANYYNTIHLIISLPEGVMKGKSHSMANVYSNPNYNTMTSEKTLSPIKRFKSEEDILLDDIDDIYGYLRAGKQPPVGKYTRTGDFDEETYYEDPMTKFKSQIEKLDNCDVIGNKRNTDYMFVDTKAMLDGKHNRVVVTGHRQPDDTPPDLPPRQYKQTKSSPVIHAVPTIAAQVDGHLSSTTGSSLESRSTRTEQSRSVLFRTILKESQTNSRGIKRRRDGKKENSSTNFSHVRKRRRHSSML
ncbi:hypothetical protein DPMN_085970 [Dreissena polymorpha]|uniref:CABIT domain-containing protein n=1 Tax=Dreissena polymorpha TaxID=45954 RepID=A0A9D3YHZ6_DREPO|nr:hypothetical protein DPMN_085970 [Dreissena polymorpha]